MADPTQAVRGAGFSSPTSARKMVLVAMLGLTVINFYRSKTPESDVNLFKRLWGTGVLGLMLSVLADFAPTIAGPFAMLVVLGSLTRGGDKAIQNALSGLSAKAGGSGGSAPPTSKPIAQHNTAGVTR